MKIVKNVLRGVLLIIVCLTLLVSPGCATKKQTGALAGAGVGALIGQAIGGNTAGTLIGAGVGTGVGYLIGNEMDKKDAKSRETVTAQETAPLANTTWQLVSIVPDPKKNVKSLVIHFKPDGTAVTTRIFVDDSIKTATERYRVVGETLIINKNDYVINARFTINGDQMIANTDKYSIVLRRVDI
jgi:uncharacterized protein YcfJ